MVLITVQLHARVYLLHLAIYTHMQESFATNGLKELFVVTLAVVDHRSKNQHFLSGILTENKIQYLVICILHHLLASGIRVCISCTSKEESQKIIHFCDRSNCRTRITRCSLLIYANNRRETGDLVHIWALHSTNISSCIRGESLHITALSFGKDSIKGKG